MKTISDRPYPRRGLQDRPDLASAYSTTQSLAPAPSTISLSIAQSTPIEQVDCATGRSAPATGARGWLEPPARRDEFAEECRSISEEHQTMRGDR